MTFRWLLGCGLAGLALVGACGDDVQQTATAATTSATTGTGAGGSYSEECAGVKPPSDAYDATPGPQLFGGGGAGGDEPGAGGAGGAGGNMAGAGGVLGPTDEGSDAPTYQLEDFQPQSCGHEAVYGLEPFKGKVVLAALLAGW